MSLVLAAPAGRRQRSAAPAPEGAARARGHERPAGRAGSPGRRGPGQGPPESPGAGDFATLQPGRLHRRRLRPPPPQAVLPQVPECTPQATAGALPTSRSRWAAGGRGRQQPRGARGPGVAWTARWSCREKPTWSGWGSNRLEWGLGSGGWRVGGRGRGHSGRNPALGCVASPEVPPRKAPWSCRTFSLLRHAWGPRVRPTHPARFQQTSFQTNRLSQLLWLHLCRAGWGRPIASGLRRKPIPLRSAARPLQGSFSLFFNSAQFPVIKNTSGSRVRTAPGFHDS